MGLISSEERNELLNKCTLLQDFSFSEAPKLNLVVKASLTEAVVTIPILDCFSNKDEWEEDEWLFGNQLEDRIRSAKLLDMSSKDLRPSAKPARPRLKKKIESPDPLIIPSTSFGRIRATKGQQLPSLQQPPETVSMQPEQQETGTVTSVSKPAGIHIKIFH